MSLRLRQFAVFVGLLSYLLSGSAAVLFHDPLAHGCHGAGHDCHEHAHEAELVAALGGNSEGEPASHEEHKSSCAVCEFLSQASACFQVFAEFAPAGATGELAAAEYRSPRSSFRSAWQSRGPPALV